VSACVTWGLERKFKITGMMAVSPGASLYDIFFAKKYTLLTSGLEDREG